MQRIVAVHAANPNGILEKSAAAASGGNFLLETRIVLVVIQRNVEIATDTHNAHTHIINVDIRVGRQGLPDGQQVHQAESED